MKIKIENSYYAVKHFENLEKLGSKESGYQTYLKLKRLENKATILNTKECNGEITTEEGNFQSVRISAHVKFLFKDNSLINWLFYYNGDPRGYALKIDFGKSEKMEKITKDDEELFKAFYKDFGGYGILAPEF